MLTAILPFFLSWALACSLKGLCEGTIRKHLLSDRPEPDKPILQHCSYSVHWLRRERLQPLRAPPACQRGREKRHSPECFSLTPTRVGLGGTTIQPVDVHDLYQCSSKQNLKTLESCAAYILHVLI